MSHRVFHAISSEQTFTVTSKVLEGEYTDFGKIAIAQRMLERVSIEYNIDIATLKIVECTRSGVILKSYYP